jgi:hypothetical protein
VPGLGSSGAKVQISTGWRYSYSHQSYFDSRPNHDFNRNWRPQERQSILDVTARYKISKRVSATLSVPIVFNRFSALLPPLGDNGGERYGWRGRGISDITLYADSWILDPSNHPFGNIALGIGIKTPTGNWNQKATFPDETGKRFANRAIWPVSIMPGDGGTGVIVGFNAYKVFRQLGPLRGNTVFASGSYLFNPRATNGTQSIVSTLGVPVTANFANDLTNSVTDSYNLQAGTAIRLPKTWDKPYLKDVRLRFISNLQGIPFRDRLGGNGGYRQPGYTVSMGPSATFSLGKNFWIVDVPFVVAGHVDAGRTMLPGLPVRRNGVVLPGVLNPRRSLGMIPPLAVAVRYVRSL